MPQSLNRYHSPDRRAAAEQLVDAIIAVLETMAAPPKSEREHLLTPEDAAEELGISRANVFKIIRAGAMGSALIGGRRKISRADLDAYIAVQRQGPAR